MHVNSIIISIYLIIIHLSISYQPFTYHSILTSCLSIFFIAGASNDCAGSVTPGNHIAYGKINTKISINLPYAAFQLS